MISDEYAPVTNTTMDSFSLNRICLLLISDGQCVTNVKIKFKNLWTIVIAAKGNFLKVIFFVDENILQRKWETTRLKNFSIKCVMFSLLLSRACKSHMVIFATEVWFLEWWPQIAVLAKFLLLD